MVGIFVLSVAGCGGAPEQHPILDQSFGEKYGSERLRPSLGLGREGVPSETGAVNVGLSVADTRAVELPIGCIPGFVAVCSELSQLQTTLRDMSSFPRDPDWEYIRLLPSRCLSNGSIEFYAPSLDGYQVLGNVREVLRANEVRCDESGAFETRSLGRPEWSVRVSRSSLSDSTEFVGTIRGPATVGDGTARLGVALPALPLIDLGVEVAIWCALRGAESAPEDRDFVDLFRYTVVSRLWVELTTNGMDVLSANEFGLGDDDSVARFGEYLERQSASNGWWTCGGP